MQAEERYSIYTNNIEKRIEKYWNRRSTDFSRVRQQELSSKDAARWLQLLKEHLPSKSSLKILDVGTGAGFFAILLAGQGHEVIGVDMSSDMLHEAKKNMIATGFRAEFRKMDAQNLDFPDRCFDVVISRNLTWTLPDAMQAYREWHRVLKTGGILMNFDSDCGKTVFSKAEDQADVHAGIADELLMECNAIKEELRISTHRRPAWDISLLRELGFEITSDADISSLVHQDSAMGYDAIPLFAIYAKKTDER